MEQRTGHVKRFQQQGRFDPRSVVGQEEGVRQAAEARNDERRQLGYGGLVGAGLRHAGKRDIVAAFNE